MLLQCVRNRGAQREPGYHSSSIPPPPENSHYLCSPLRSGTSLVGVARLRIADFDLRRQLLTVRDTKFTKSRLVPFGPRLATLLTNYIQRLSQQRGCARENHATVLIPEATTSPSVGNHPDFPGARSPTRIVCSRRHGPPTIHCLRHSFAVSTLLRWYRSGVDPELTIAPTLDTPGPCESQLDGYLSHHHDSAVGTERWASLHDQTTETAGGFSS